MTNQYNSVIDYLFSLEKFGVSFGLHKIEAILKEFDSPQDKLKVIHVAGTNGKGSVCATIESILIEHGYQTALYTSPHLIKFNERIRINREDISDNDIIKYVTKIRPIADIVNASSTVTFFDFTTALAYLYFYEKGVDYAIMETGLGGRLDSTNIVKSPLVSVITNVTKEHEEYLGKDIKSIAYEKAGIIKVNSIAVTSATDSDVISLLSDVATEQNSKLFILDKGTSINVKGQQFDYISPKYNFKNLQSSLAGFHQITNSSLAVFALEKCGIVLDEIKTVRGLKNIKWEGRLEKVLNTPLFIIDGAHNPDGAAVLRSNLTLFNYNKLILIVAVMQDKDLDAIFKEIIPPADTIIFTKANIDRSADMALLKEKSLGYNKETFFLPNISDAIQKGIEIAGDKDMVLFTGSLYAVGEAKRYFGKLSESAFTMGNNYKFTK